MKAFKFTPLRSIYILFSFLATTTASLAVGPNIIHNNPNPNTPFFDEEIAVVGEAFGPYQIVTDQDGSDSPDAPFLYQVQNLPAGLSFNAFTGIITGSPTTSSTIPFNVTLKATDENDLTGESGILLITVNDPATPPAITSPLVITATATTSYTYTITANNGLTTFSVVGLSAMETDAITAIDPTTGSFSFTPSVSGVGDSINLLIKAEDGDGEISVREILQVTILPAPTTPTKPIQNFISPIGGPFDPQQTTTVDITTNVFPAPGATIESVVVLWMNPPNKPDESSRDPIMLTTLDGPSGLSAYSGTINLGFDPENLEVGGGNINLEVRAYQTNAVDTADFLSDSINFRVDPLLDVLFPDDNYERGSFSLGDIFASARISTNDFKEISARISGPGIVNLVVDADDTDNPNGVFYFNTQQSIDLGGTYDVTVTLEDNSGAISEERKQLFIASTVAQPTAVIVSPNPGFTNVVFTPALFTFEQATQPVKTRDDDGNVTRTSITYNIEQVTKGQGYYPRNSNGLNMPFFFEGDDSGTANVNNITTTNGRLEQLRESLTIIWQEDSNGYGGNGTGFVDDSNDPGRLSRIDIAAEFFSGGPQLDSFKIWVNGSEILNGNLNPGNGPVVPPFVAYPLPDSGAIMPGKYVVQAQAFDVNGTVVSANPVAFEILPYEPLEIALQRSVVSGASSSDPIRIGESATFLAEVEPIDEIESVKFFELLSGEELGDGSRVQIDGQEFYRCAIVFPEAGNFKVYAEGTSFNGQTANSAPVDIRVESGEFPVVSITAPLSNSDVPAGDNLEILINADDPDGQITVVEVFNGSTTNPDNSLGLANPTGFAGQYRLNFTPTVADAGVLNLIARATDDLGNSTDSNVALIGVALGAVPVIEILSPTVEGTEFFVGQPFEIRARITDASPGGSISTATLSDVEYLTLFDGAILDIDDSQSFSNEVMSQSSTPDEYVYMATINSPDVVGLVITATDNSGNVTKSAPFGFTVTSGVVPDVAINTVNSTVLGEVSVEPLLAGIEYEILTVGTTNFATLGPVLVNEDSLVTGQTYQIVTEGTDFTTAGAPSNAVGTVFIAGANASTGSTGEAIDISIGTVFTYNGTPGAGTGTVLRSSANATHSNVITVEPLLDGVQYEIVTPGDTVFTTLGAADSNVGTTFISDGTPGAGTGTVRISGAIPADLASMVTLDISASDSDGNVTQVEVLNNGISLGFANLVRVDSTVTPPLSTYRFAYQASSPGLLNFQVRATDDLGNVGVSNIAKVTVVTGVIPTAAITSPSSGASITAGRNMEILVTAEDADGSVTSVAIYANGEPLRDIQTGEILYASPTGNANEYLFSRRTSAENLGNLNLEARVTDNQGNVGFSEIVPINVVLGAVPQITILSPQPGQEFFINQPFVIRASITDADGTITSAIFARDQQLRTERQIDNNGAIRLVIIEGSRSFNGDEVMVATATADEYQFMATLDTPDLVGLQIIATDDDGNVSVSREVQFTVTNGIAPDLAITAPLGIVSVDALITAEKYEIVTVGTTNFASLGPVAVNEDSLVTGQTYQIVTEGTDFTTAGAPSNAVGTVFIAGANASTGSTGEAIDISVGTIFTSNGTAGAGTGTVGPVYERGNIVAIDIDASDSDGSISEVKVFNGSTELGTANIVSNGKYRYNYTANAVGRINLNAQARDDLGNPGISNIETITIVTGAIPTVGITLPGGLSYTAGDMITIDVDADDADGSVTSVEIFNGDVSLGTASKVSAGAVDYRFNLQTSLTDLGDLQLNARATDNSGNVSISTFVEAKVVTGAVPVVTIDSPTDGDSIKSGETLEILIEASDADPDGFITSVEVFNGALSLGFANLVAVDNTVTPAEATYRFDYPATVADIGNLNLQARATDNQGIIGFSDLAEVSVIIGEIPAVTINTVNSTVLGAVGVGTLLDGVQYEILTAGTTDFITLGAADSNAGTIFTSNGTAGTGTGTVRRLYDRGDIVADLGSLVTLGISASDSDGNVTQVEVFNGSNSIGLASLVGVDTYRFDYQASSPGLLNLQVRSTDDLGNIGFSDLVPVSVITGAIPAVSITSPTDGNSIKSGETLEITVDADDLGGFITSVEVFNNDVSLGLANPTGAVNEFLLSYRTSAADLGNLNLQARAVDNQGNVGYSVVVAYSVVQGAVPTVSIDDPLNGEVFFINTAIAASFTATDVDNSIVSVEVFRNGSSVGFASLMSSTTAPVTDPDTDIVTALNYTGSYEFTLTATATAGLQRLTAVATDELGNRTTSSEVSILLSSGVSPVTVLNTVNGTVLGEVSVDALIDGEQYEILTIGTGVDATDFTTLGAADSNVGTIFTYDLEDGAVPAGTGTVRISGAVPVDLGSMVTLGISASDSDGNVTQVQVFNGANPIGFAYLVGVDTYRFDYQASSPGLLNLQVRSTDDLGNIGFSDLVPVSVITGAIPTVSITSPNADVSITSGKDIEVLVTAEDSDGQVTAVRVFNNGVFSGSARPTGNLYEYRYILSTVTPELGRLNGSYNLEARVVDNQGNVGVSEIVPINIVLGSVPQIEILSPQAGDVFSINQPFVIRARIEDAQGGTITSATLLDVKRILDPSRVTDNGIQVYTVREGSQSFTQELMQSTSEPDVYQFVATLDTPDLVGLQITATDDDGNSIVSSTVQFTVTNGIAPDVTITAPVSGANYTRGDIVTIEIDASDSDGSISEVKVLNGTTELGMASLVSNGKYSFNYTADAVGRVNLSARATDDLGNAGISNIETIIIVLGDIPTVTITSPAEATSYTAGDVITIDVDADDTDGFVTSVDIFNGDVSLGTASKVSETEYRLNLSTSLTDLGDLQLNARATDNSGNVSISTFVEVDVLTGAVPTGSITLPDGPYFEGDMLTIDVNVDDLDGYVTSVVIFDGATEIGVASKVNDTKYRLVHGPLTPGNLQLRAVVTDDRGNESASTPLSTSVNTNTLPILSIDSPAVEMRTFNYGEVITFEITASDSDGFITEVKVFNGATELGSALKVLKVDSVNNEQYLYSLDTALLTAGTKFISVSAVDNRGNASTEMVEINLNVVPFSVNFVTQTATDTAPGFITTPITSHVIEGRGNEFFSATRRFTVEIGGIDASTLKSLEWQLDDGSPAVSQTLVLQTAEDGQEDAEEASMTYSQVFEFSDTGTLTVTATNSDDIEVENLLTVFVDLPALEGDTPASRAAFAATLFPSDQYNDSQYQTVALVYKTLTGQWPTQTQLETGLSFISQDTSVQSNQTTVPFNGSITAGGTQTLSFDYSEGDEVTISVMGDGTNANPLLDATLTVIAPDGSSVGFSADNFNSLTGILSFDPALSFIASQTGTYTATVGGYRVFQSGDFAIKSISTTIESNTNTIDARALVAALKNTYNGANGFLADSAAGSSLSSAFVAQIYLNKHELGIMTFNSALLKGRLRGVESVKSTGDIVPGYQSNVVNFVADFALDVDLATGSYALVNTGDGYPYSKIVYYGRPNNPLSSWEQARAEIQSDVNLISALSALLGIQNPTDLDLAPYVGMTLEEALAEIFAADQYVGFAAATDSFVAKRMEDLGIVDGTKAGANDDADGDGVSNIAEILLMQDPSSVASSPGSAQASTEVTGNATYFVMEFVRVKPSLTPGVSVVLECAESLSGPFMPVSNVESKLSSDGINQPADIDYERVEFRVDTSSIDCNFFRLSVQ